MGARLVVKFGESDPCPMVYLHYGGEYERDVRNTLDEFFGELAKISDKRLGDPPYLAAKFVVWAACYPRHASLDFLGVGVVNDAGYGDAVCRVFCNGTTGYSIEKSLDNA